MHFTDPEPEISELFDEDDEIIIKEQQTEKEIKDDPLEAQLE